MAETNVVRETGAEQDGRLKPFGPVAAAFVSAGIGAVVLGILTTLGEANEGVGSFLEFNSRVGPLSGKTILAVAAWLVSWAILHSVLRRRDLDERKVFAWVGVMFAIALILTFPIFFRLFEQE
jgi:hypothetical protein